MSISSADARRIVSSGTLLWLFPIASACGMGNRSGDLKAGSFGDLSNPPAERRDSYQEIDNACGLPSLVTGGLSLQRRPYLQQATDRSVRLMWTAGAGALAGATITRPDGTPAMRVEAVEDAIADRLLAAAQWRAPVDGLSPDTVYCYDVGANDGTWTRTGFKTAPAAGSGRPVRFVAFGDSGSGGSDQYAALAQIRTTPFDLLIHTGDIAYAAGSRNDFERRFFDVYADILQRFPIFPASGNHEYQTQGAQPFRDVFGLPENGGPEGLERWYSFNWGDVHFVALDTQRTGPVQADWLEADLTANQLPWTVVYGHRPPFSSGHHGSDAAFRSTFVPVLERHRVPLVLNGHEHDYERTKPLNGVTYIVTGGGGRGTRNVGRSSFTAFSEAVIHFVYVEITGDTLTLHAIDGTGVEFDSLVLRRPSS
jgi:hypothetical protein